MNAISNSAKNDNTYTGGGFANTTAADEFQVVYSNFLSCQIFKQIKINIYVTTVSQSAHIIPLDNVKLYNYLARFISVNYHRYRIIYPRSIHGHHGEPWVEVTFDHGAL